MFVCDPDGVDEDEAMYAYQEKDILECEFYVVETLQFDLILHHPFPSLLQYVRSLGVRWVLQFSCSRLTTSRSQVHG